MTSFLRNLWSDESGATMVEYALMVALIAIVCIAAVSLLGTQIRGVFQSSAGTLAAASEEACVANGGDWTPASDGGTPLDSSDDEPGKCEY
jgi:pilus assembly protein Flp/PilA